MNRFGHSVKGGGASIENSPIVINIHIHTSGATPTFVQRINRLFFQRNVVTIDHFDTRSDEDVIQAIEAKT